MKINVSSLSLEKIVLGIMVISAVMGGFFSTKMFVDINKSIESAKESARPAKINLITITTPNCTDCFNVDSAVADFKKQNITVGEEKSIIFDSAEAQSLIKQLDIKRVPTYLATGEITKENLIEFLKTNGEIKNNTFVFTRLTPLFIDTQTKKEMGAVSVTILADSSNLYFPDPKLIIDQLKNSGIKISKQKKLEWDSAEGQRLIKKYTITKIPTFLFSEDADAYDALKSVWTQIGTIEKDKTYVARDIFTPYRDIKSGQIMGLVQAIYVTDSTCPDCYDPAVLQKGILTKNFGLAITSSKTVDINSEKGKGLKQKYNLSAVPTVLLSPDADLYANLKRIWKSVGTVEKDGWYVFREMKQLGGAIYKDLTTDKIIRPEQSSANPGQ